MIAHQVSGKTESTRLARPISYPFRSIPRISRGAVHLAVHLVDQVTLGGLRFAAPIRCWALRQAPARDDDTETTGPCRCRLTSLRCSHSRFACGARAYDGRGPRVMRLPLGQGAGLARHLHSASTQFAVPLVPPSWHSRERLLLSSPLLSSS